MNDMTFGQAWAYGGPLMWVLAALSVAALAAALYIWISQTSWICLPAAMKRLEVAPDVESEGRRIAARLHANVDLLADLAAIAPLVGLLGTVLGMFQAFSGIAADVAAGAKPVLLAQGISQAIITTIFGLAIAIPCLVLYAFLRRRTARRVAEMERAVETTFKKAAK